MVRMMIKKEGKRKINKEDDGGQRERNRGREGEGERIGVAREVL